MLTDDELERMYEDTEENEKSFDELDYLSRVADTLERCGIYGEDDILLWDGMTKEKIINFLQEYFDNALQEHPLDFIPERADIILDVLDERKEELEKEKREEEEWDKFLEEGN